MLIPPRNSGILQLFKFCPESLFLLWSVELFSFWYKPESSVGAGKGTSFLRLKERIITNYLEKCPHISLLTEVWKKFCFVVLFSNVIWYFDVYIVYSFSSYNLYAMLVFWWENWAQVKMLYVALLLLNILPLHFSSQLLLS